MDERKKQIDELEKNKRGSLASLDTLLERFGECLLGRMNEEAGEEAASFREYCRLKREITDSESAIQQVEEQIQRLKELDEKTAQKEQEDSEQAKSLNGLYTQMGKELLEGSGVYPEFSASFRDQADGLTTKIQSLENRLSEIEQKEGSNVLSWIGKNAQGLVLRSFLTKAQDNLELLYRSAGERFCRPDNSEEDLSDLPEIKRLAVEIENARAQVRALSRDLVEFREERRRIADGFIPEGGPQKKIQTLKNYIGQEKGELRALYRRFGAVAGSPERKEFFNSLITAEDQPLLDDAARIRQQISDDERLIEKLKASLAIDDEKREIEKCRRLIEEKKLKIAEAEKDITEFENSINDSEKYIADLQKLL